MTSVHARPVLAFIRRARAALAAFAGFASVALTAGCEAPTPREAKPSAALFAERATFDSQFASGDVMRSTSFLAHAKRKHDQRQDTTVPATLDVLIISGGGDWGAFGAGVLKGWGKVAGPGLRRPSFDIVTGVSTGALIAPFAFDGRETSIDQILNLYREPKKDWFRSRGWFYFLPANASFATTPGLERDLKHAINADMVQRIASECTNGRMLLVNTTDVDFGAMHVWDMGAESRRALETGNFDHLYSVILASTSIPGAFPPRLIDGRLYVDGGITANIIYGQRVADTNTISARWREAFPTLPAPKIRYWVIFNNQIRFPPQVTEERWPSVISRSTIMATQAATVNGIRHLFAQAEILRLRHGDEVEVRYIAVPDSFELTESRPFAKSTMTTLADMGEKMGADPKSWLTTAP